MFTSVEQYRSHHEGHIRHGGVLVVSPPLHVGTRRRLTLRIAETTYDVDGFVVYRQDGTVGFVIEGFEQQKEALRELTLREP